MIKRILNPFVSSRSLLPLAIIFLILAVLYYGYVFWLANRAERAQVTGHDWLARQEAIQRLRTSGAVDQGKTAENYSYVTGKIPLPVAGQ